MCYLSLVFNLVVVILFLVVLPTVVGPENRAEVAVGDGQPHHRDHVGHQEEDHLVAVVQQGRARVSVWPHHDTRGPANTRDDTCVSKMFVSYLCLSLLYTMVVE